MMNNKAMTLIAVAGFAGIASAEVLLIVDLSVVNQITINATDGASGVTASGTDLVGFYLASFFNDASFSAGDTFLSGGLSSAENVSSGAPNLHSFDGSFGLNVWNYTDDPQSTFTAGQVAFTGSATWSITAPEYAAMLAGNFAGDIYFAADSDGDIPAASILGTYRVIPAPSSLALLGLGGIVAGRRRR